jgi:protein involved in polysaccharide export with SLBB domain
MNVRRWLGTRLLAVLLVLLMGVPALPLPGAAQQYGQPGQPGQVTPPMDFGGTQPRFGDQQGGVNIFLGDPNRQQQQPSRPPAPDIAPPQQQRPQMLQLQNPCPAGAPSQSFQIVTPVQPIPQPLPQGTAPVQQAAVPGGTQPPPTDPSQQQYRPPPIPRPLPADSRVGFSAIPDQFKDPQQQQQPTAPNGGIAPWPLVEELSSIEAAFQMPVSSIQGISQFVFQYPSPALAALDPARFPDQQSPRPLTTTPTAFLGPFGTPLRQFGYSQFSSPVSTFAPVDDVPVGPDYVIGPGDDLMISVWGPVETTVVRTVDRNGRIVLPKLGDLRVWGLTFSQADRLIREQLSRYFRGFQTSVTLGRLRTVRVYVVGEVCRPGVYTLSPLSTVSNALFSAGGPTKLGSLRQVRLQRAGHTVGTVDLYDFLQRGDRARDFRLESGDTIFVPPIGAVAAITGEVKRPAIYELRGDARVSDAIDMAGGLTPRGYLKRVQIVRALPSAERTTIDVDVTGFYLRGDAASNPMLHSGDLVLIYQSDNRVYNTVKVDGAVKYPGSYELKPLMRISELLQPGRLLPEASPDRVEVSRRRPDLSVEVITVNLTKAWKGEADSDLMLRPLDEVSVRTEFRDMRIITLTGQVARPGRYTIAENERLSSVLERAGGFTERAYLKGAVYTRTSLRKVEQEQLDAFVKLQEQRILTQASTEVIGGDTQGNEALARQQIIQSRRELLRALAAKVALGRMVVRLAPPDQLRGTPDDVIPTDGDMLDIPEPPSSVFVLGSVRNSTSVLYRPGESIQYYVGRVGGFSKSADQKEIHVVKADGSAVAGFSKLRDVDPGDTIIVPPKEEEKIRVWPYFRDILGVLSSTLLAFAALAVLF